MTHLHQEAPSKRNTYIPRSTWWTKKVPLSIVAKFFCHQCGKLPSSKKKCHQKTKSHIPYMGKDGACLLHARIKDTQLDSPSNTR